VKTLVVGAGAVGQAFGYHLRKGGAEVSFLVKPKHAPEAERGFDLYLLNRRNPRREPTRFEGFGVVTSAAEAARRAWDCVVICVSSTGLRTGWLDEIAPHLGDATVVVLQPGLDDAAYVAARVPEDRIVSGMIALIAYAAPLPGESVPRPGTAVWLPPFSRIPLSGPDARVRPLVEALSRGGLRARVHPDVASALAFGGAVLSLTVVALECAGWSFRTLREDRALLPLTARATREALAVCEKERGRRAPLGPRLLRPLHVRLATRIAPSLVPFDLERYFQVHFTKVGDQTRHSLRTYIETAQRHGLAADALRALAERLP
jgi:2-dehydropantoate 2-reductase